MPRLLDDRDLCDFKNWGMRCVLVPGHDGDHCPGDQWVPYEGIVRCSCDDTERLRHVVPDTVQVMGRRWGSDCVKCGNATPDSMRCDNCGSNLHTIPLYTPAELQLTD